MAQRKQRYRRGYPLAILIGLEERRAVIWRVFSEVAKLDSSVEQQEKAATDLYDFHESIVNKLRPAFKDGTKSVVIASPLKTSYAKILLDHIRKHHAWLIREGPNAVAFEEMTGSAVHPHEVHELVKTKRFRDAIGETTSRDADNIAASLEKALDSKVSDTLVFYSLEEIEELFDDQKKQNNLGPEHLVSTDEYLADIKVRNRILRLLQISNSRGIKTTIVNSKTKAGLRLCQLGGLVCFAKSK